MVLISTIGIDYRTASIKVLFDETIEELMINAEVRLFINIFQLYTYMNKIKNSPKWLLCSNIQLSKYIDAMENNLYFLHSWQLYYLLSNSNFFSFLRKSLIIIWKKFNFNTQLYVNRSCVERCSNWRSWIIW